MDKKYFDGIKQDDKVYDFLYGWGKVLAVYKNSCNCIIVSFNNGEQHQYDDNGFEIDISHKKKLYKNQTLFWDELKFEKPNEPEIILKEDYSDLVSKNRFGNSNSIWQLIKIAKLLALRDQECARSRGYRFQKGKINWTIKKDLAEEKNNKWIVTCTDYYYFPDRVYFKTEEDAQKICDILNSGRFEL